MRGRKRDGERRIECWDYVWVPKSMTTRQRDMHSMSDGKGEKNWGEAMIKSLTNSSSTGILLPFALFTAICYKTQ